jgi:hypothetical protein
LWVNLYRFWCDKGVFLLYCSDGGILSGILYRYWLLVLFCEPYFSFYHSLIYIDKYKQRNIYITSL